MKSNTMIINGLARPANAHILKTRFQSNCKAKIDKDFKIQATRLANPMILLR